MKKMKYFYIALVLFNISINETFLKVDNLTGS